MIIDKLSLLQQQYKQGKNILAYVRDRRKSNQNSPEEILISYDLQAGSYIKEAESKPMKKKYDLYTSEVTEIIRSFGGNKIKSLLEVGFGEATTFSGIISKLASHSTRYYGFDISWSRARYGLEYLRQMNPNSNIEVFIADLFQTPFSDNSIDIVYTSHSLEPNGGKEIEAIKELFRITNRYLILLEPSYELGHAEARRRIREHGYVKNLRLVSEKLGLNVVAHKLLQNPINHNNPTSLIVIKKDIPKKIQINPFACPITNTPLKKTRGAYFSEKNLIAYPVLDNIPLLTKQYAVCATHFQDSIFSD